jgi:RNA polymerase sigma-70 factor, ECF subfamily
MNEPVVDFETLYRRYASDVYRFALYLSGRPDQADDIAAETFVRAWTSPEPIRVGTVKAYLFMIARNLYREDLRRSRRYATVSDTRRDEIRDSTPGPDVSVAARSDLRRLLAGLQQLSEIDRAVLIMRTEEGVSYEEIAAAVGISVGAARVKVHRARARLIEWQTKEDPWK